MKLTEIQSLDSNYTQTDVCEIAAVAASTIGGTPASTIRWSGVEPAVAEHFMRQGYIKSVKHEFTMDRISTLMTKDKSALDTDKSEHLVMRDLDMDHIDAGDQSSSPPLPPGRIIAHGFWQYWASFGAPPPPPPPPPPKDHKAETDTTTTTTTTGIVQTLAPTLGPNAGLETLINSKIESILTQVFKGLPMLGLLGISTLTPSHLRQGIAKRITQWINPCADHLALPVILFASPLGLFLYRKCGDIVEYPDLDAIVDLTEWGGEGLHRHTMMIRWPQDVDRLPSEWKKWRDEHGVGIKG